MRRSSASGFTLVELLVVVIIIGILSAIVVSAMVGWINKAKKTEAYLYLGQANRAQQAYYLEHNRFANTIATLGSEIPPETNSYRYLLEGNETLGQILAQPKSALIFSFRGCAFDAPEPLGGTGKSDTIDTLIINGVVPGQDAPDCP